MRGGDSIGLRAQDLGIYGSCWYVGLTVIGVVIRAHFPVDWTVVVLKGNLSLYSWLQVGLW